jgi:hypothetical protein
VGVEAGGAERSRMAERPSLDPRYTFEILLPLDWPETHAYRCGVRLATTGEHDIVPTMLRQGLPIDQYLEPAEVAAHLTIGSRTFERWFRLGWSVGGEHEEG